MFQDIYKYEHRIKDPLAADKILEVFRREFPRTDCQWKSVKTEACKLKWCWPPDFPTTFEDWLAVTQRDNVSIIIASVSCEDEKGGTKDLRFFKFYPIYSCPVNTKVHKGAIF